MQEMKGIMDFFFSFFEGDSKLNTSCPTSSSHTSSKTPGKARRKKINVGKKTVMSQPYFSLVYNELILNICISSDPVIFRILC